MAQLINLNLPAFAFLDAAQDESLNGRNVILHVRSASVVEILSEDQPYGLKPGVITYKFNHGIERFIAILHFSTIVEDKEDIIELIMKPCADWFCEYCDWEDNNIINADKSINN